MKAIGLNKEIEPGAWLKQLAKAPKIKTSPRDKFDRANKNGNPFKSKKKWDSDTSRDDRDPLDIEPQIRRSKPNPNKNPETRPEGGVIPLKARNKKESKPDNRNKGKPNWSNEGGKKSKPKNRARPKPDGDKQGVKKENTKKKRNDRPRKEKTNAPRGKNAVLKRRR